MDGKVLHPNDLYGNCTLNILCYHAYLLRGLSEGGSVACIPTRTIIGHATNLSTPRPNGMCVVVWCETTGKQTVCFSKYMAHDRMSV